MKIKILEEQVSHIKSLDSKKKQRKFLLDCLVEQITSIGKSVKISDLPIKDRQEYGTGNFDFNKAYVEAIDRIIPQDELLKFDALEEINEEFEKNIKTNLFTRDFSLSQILNNRGLIGATIEETINEMKKIDESANSGKKYTEEDMCTAFFKGRKTERKEELVEGENHFPYYIDVSFKEWFEKFNEGKK